LRHFLHNTSHWKTCFYVFNKGNLLNVLIYIYSNLSLQNYYKLLTKLKLSNKTKLDGNMGPTVNYIVLSFTPHVISSYSISCTNCYRYIILLIIWCEPSILHSSCYKHHSDIAFVLDIFFPWCVILSTKRWVLQNTENKSTNKERIISFMEGVLYFPNVFHFHNICF